MEMMESCPPSPILIPVPHDQVRQALSLIFNYLPPRERDEQIKAVLPSPPIDGNHVKGLFGAFREQKMVGAIFAQLQPGKTALVWLPRLMPEEAPATAVQLLEAMNSWLQQQQVELAQMVVEQITESDERCLMVGGYGYLTDLLYLACLPEKFPTVRPNSDLEFLPYVSSNRERLKTLIDATYQDSRDCPKLNDARSTEDVLIGYQSSGVFMPELWSIVRRNGQDAGCLLLADHPEYDNVELVYMGLAPRSRGRGAGMEIARFAQWQTLNLGRARLVLAVDAANRPAIDMYSAVGFQAWDRRRVYFRRIQGDLGYDG
jgi:mycothiol synthase